MVSAMCCLGICEPTTRQVERSFDGAGDFQLRADATLYCDEILAVYPTFGGLHVELSGEGLLASGGLYGFGAPGHPIDIGVSFTVDFVVVDHVDYRFRGVLRVYDFDLPESISSAVLLDGDGVRHELAPDYSGAEQSTVHSGLLIPGEYTLRLIAGLRNGHGRVDVAADLSFGVVAIENRSWSSVKGLYD